MAKTPKNKFGNFLLAFVAGMLLTAWWFIGSPQIWRQPSFPPKVGEARAASGDVILLWSTANGPVPAGWQCISCTGAGASSTFKDQFLRASSSYGNATSGANIHNHSLTFVSAATGTTALSSNGDTGGTVFNQDNHIHTWPNLTANNAENIPPYQEFNLIYKNNPTELPVAIVAIFDSVTLPSSGWTRYFTFDESYIFAGNGLAASGTASNTHTTPTATSSNPARTITDTGNNVAGARGHGHQVLASTTISQVNKPPYVGAVFAYNSSGATTSIPAGLIAIFDTTPPSGWTAVSGAAPWAGNFLISSSTFGATGGSEAAHNHSGTMLIPTSVNQYGQATTTNGGNSSGAVQFAAATHTHTPVNYTVANNTSGLLPVYRDVILAKRDVLTVAGTTGTQTASMNIPSTNNSVGGAFTLIANTSSAVSVTQIIVSDTGDVNANSNLSNLDLYYDTDSPCAYGGGETLFGTAASFNVSEKATITGTMSVATSQVCVYAVLDVGAGASANQKIDIEITAPSTEVTVSTGSATPSTAIAISGQTNLVAPTVTCTTAASTVDLTTIDNTAIYSKFSTTTIATDNSTGFTMKVYGTGSASGDNPGLWKSPDLIESVTSTATTTLAIGSEGYGIQATTSSGNGIGIEPRYNFVTSSAIVGGLATSSASSFTVASSSATITSETVTITFKAAVAVVTPAGAYSDTVTLSCSINP